ncbi:hypothetical protein [Devosia sp.]|uniref:hypothetical protein n=1 Tax=Devosia sp. TaxID=1871048 RepID=UPI003265CF44
MASLSARLTRLRHLLSDPLFIPAASGRGMVPTPHAAALQPEPDPLLERFNDFVNSAHVFDPAVQAALALKAQHAFKSELDDETRRALFPQNAA